MAEFIDCKTEKYTLDPIVLNKGELEFKRVDLEFYGVEHKENSCEVRVFLNNKEVDENTELDHEKNHYVGTLHVLGHGGCFGDPGHCSIKPHNNPFDHRLSHPLTPQFRFLKIPEKLHNIVRESESLEITVIVIPAKILKMDGLPNTINVNEKPFKFKHLRLGTYE